MQGLTQTKMTGLPDLGHRLRQLRWFRRVFKSCVAELEVRFGLNVVLDEDVLADVFVTWVEAIDHQKSFARLDRSDFIKFCGGVMLQELIRRRPAVVSLPAKPSADIPETALFWPDGFLYATFCISAVVAVHQQEFGETLPVSDSVDDVRTWWSFRENAQEMPSYAISFLDRFVGAEPNWTVPQHVASRAAMLAAATRASLLTDQR